MMPSSSDGQQRSQRIPQNATTADASTALFLGSSYHRPTNHGACGSGRCSASTGTAASRNVGYISSDSQDGCNNGLGCSGFFSNPASSSSSSSASSSVYSRRPPHDRAEISTEEHGLPDTSRTDADIAARLGRLSVKERNYILEDMHGVASTATANRINAGGSPVAATWSGTDSGDARQPSVRAAPPHAAAQAQTFRYLRSDDRLLLQQMETELKKLAPKQRSVYDRAAFLTPNRVELNDSTRWLWLAFLRSIYEYHTLEDTHQRTAVTDDFLPTPEHARIARKAAAKMASYYEVKLRLFGLVNLGQTITIPEHFSEEEKRHVQMGGCQPVPCRDRSGRHVLFVSPMLYDWARLDIMLKKLYYTIMTMVRTDHDLQFQIRGLVTVFFMLGDDRCHPINFARIFSNGGPQLLQSLPFRDTAMHACYNQRELKPVLYVLPEIINAASKLRFQAHFGSQTECLYHLKTYGIPVEHFPLEDDGATLCSDYYIGFINERCRRELEERPNIYAGHAGIGDEESRKPSPSDEADAIIEFPTDKDVLLGRGRPYQEHSGNLQLAETIQSFMSMHQAAGKYGAKNAIAAEILQKSKRDGVRFLKRGPGNRYWVEVSEQVAKEKIAYGFRTKTKRSRARTGQGGAAPSSTSDKSMLLQRKRAIGLASTSLENGESQTDNTSQGPGSLKRLRRTQYFPTSMHANRATTMPFFQPIAATTVDTVDQNSSVPIGQTGPVVTDQGKGYIYSADNQTRSRSGYSTASLIGRTMAILGSKRDNPAAVGNDDDRMLQRVTLIHQAQLHEE